MAFIDAIYTFYEFVKGRVQVQNPNRLVKGLLAAQDWPPKEVKLEAFYLLDLGESPIGRQGYSQTIPIKFHQVQWVWIIKGTSLQQGVRAANRGDRFVTMQQMKGELINGLYPGYTDKMTWALDGNGVFVGTELVPPEQITWNPVELHEKLDKDSGVMYGSGAVRIANMTDAILS